MDLKLNASDSTLYTVLDAIEEQLDGNGCPDFVKMEILTALE